MWFIICWLCDSNYSNIVKCNKYCESWVVWFVYIIYIYKDIIILCKIFYLKVLSWVNFNVFFYFRSIDLKNKSD